jgi:hypothetical protein
MKLQPYKLLNLNMKKDSIFRKEMESFAFYLVTEKLALPAPIRPSGAVP